MKSLREQLLELSVLRWWGSLVAAIAFYTCLPVPSQWALVFENVARFAPTVGLFIGGLLYVEDAGLQHLGMPTLTRSAIVVVSWIALTGGLHLDGAMDTADGLAVQNPTRRLQVMVDSATGAFGAIAAVALVLLKTTALADIQDHRGWILMVAAGWGRWGQVVAIALYPYLKPQGKGAFHKKAIRMPQDVLMGWLLIVLVVGGLPLFFNPGLFPMVMGMSTSGCAIALLVGAWFYWQLGGHTGDTYGAVVEWTEALLLCLFTFY